MKEIVLYNGYRLPVIGLGTIGEMAIYRQLGTSREKEEIADLIPRAYEAGYRMFDMSDNYYNEQYYGEAYESLPNRGMDCVTITKFSTPSEDFETVYKESIAKIYRGRKRDNLVYLMHWPYPYLYQEIWRFMEKLYEEGKCEAIGVCNFEQEHLQCLLDTCKIKPMINQIELHPLFQQKNLCSFCNENEIQVMAYSPLGRMHEKIGNNQVLRQLSEKYQKTISQIILQWHIAQGRVVIPSSKKESHVVGNLDVLDFQLKEEDIGLINSLDCGIRIRYDPNTRFTEEQKNAMWKRKVILLSKEKEKEIDIAKPKESRVEKCYYIIYGTGNYGRKQYAFFQRIGIKPDYFCQSQLDKEYSIDDIPVLSLKNLIALQGSKIVFIAIKDEKISRKLKNLLTSFMLSQVQVYECGRFISDNLEGNAADGKKYCLMCNHDVKEFAPDGLDSEAFRLHHIIGGGFRDNVICPYCGGKDRERWQLFVLSKYTGIFSETCRVLHIAPEPGLSVRIRSNDKCDYYSGDITAGFCENRIDITDIPFRDETFDYIILNHVLEHVKEEEKAVFEIMRVLKPQGVMMFSFPICEDMPTCEIESNISEDERLRLYGQADHVRLYGNDYRQRLEQYGLAIQVFTPKEECGENEIIRYGFSPEDILLFGKKQRV